MWSVPSQGASTPCSPPVAPRSPWNPHEAARPHTRAQGVGPTNSSIPLQQLGSRDPGTLALGQMDTHPVLCCPGYVPAPTPSSRCLRWETSRLPSGSDPAFPFWRKFNDWEWSPSLFPGKPIFFRLIKAMGVLQPSPAIVMVGLPIQKECSEMGRGLFEM